MTIAVAPITVTITAIIHCHNYHNHHRYQHPLSYEYHMNEILEMILPLKIWIVLNVVKIFQRWILFEKKMKGTLWTVLNNSVFLQVGFPISGWNLICISDCFRFYQIQNSTRSMSEVFPHWIALELASFNFLFWKREGRERFFCVLLHVNNNSATKSQVSVDNNSKEEFVCCLSRFIFKLLCLFV